MLISWGGGTFAKIARGLPDLKKMTFSVSFFKQLPPSVYHF